MLMGRKRRLTAYDIARYSETEEGRKYLEYNEKVGGEPLRLMVPIGYPHGVEEMGGVIAVYEECIRQGVTWEKLLHFKIPKGVIL